MENLTLDRLAGIIAFARVASLGSYTEASRALSVSPSAVSKSIKRLEERLGIRLFTRTTRSITLTPEGAELYEKALRLIREAESIEQTAFAARNEPAGLLRVTATVPVGTRLIAPRLPEFRGKIGMLPSFLAITPVSHGLLVPVMPERWVVRHNIMAFWPESRRGNPGVRAFNSFLREIIPDPAPWNVSFTSKKKG
ncbi:LysR family transcriptional regulator [Klebsiella quasipneumoniae]|uniref:LysR family transcriptional regulator n=1 Tax=Klebsiella quasipneumoniae TaxID=1463165 RepID=UPI002B05BB78|nr:LysR family transcriptional regulator [Klebsiella quasipneumoniae]